jgi:hypothetical protein
VGHSRVLPTPESDEESEPRKEEHPAILIDGVQDRNGSRFSVDGIDDRRRPEH